MRYVPFLILSWISLTFLIVYWDDKLGKKSYNVHVYLLSTESSWANSSFLMKLSYWHETRHNPCFCTPMVHEECGLRIGIIHSFNSHRDYRSQFVTFKMYSVFKIITSSWLLDVSFVLRKKETGWVMCRKVSAIQ